MSDAYVVFEQATGRVIKTVVCPPEAIDLQLGSGHAYIEGTVTSGDFYVDLAERRIKPLKDFSLAALPLPCVVRIEGVEYKCATQPTFEFDVAGDYQIQVDAGPQYKRKVFTYAYPPRSRR